MGVIYAEVTVTNTVEDQIKAEGGIESQSDAEGDKGRETVNREIETEGDRSRQRQIEGNNFILHF